MENSENATDKESLPTQKICTWTVDEYSDGYLEAAFETDCGHAFIINDGTAEANGMKYCCYCGRELREEFNYVEGRSG